MTSRPPSQPPCSTRCREIPELTRHRQPRSVPRGQTCGRAAGGGQRMGPSRGASKEVCARGGALRAAPLSTLPVTSPSVAEKIDDPGPDPSWIHPAGDETPDFGFSTPFCAEGAQVCPNRSQDARFRLRAVTSAFRTDCTGARSRVVICFGDGRDRQKRTVRRGPPLDGTFFGQSSRRLRPSRF